MRRRPLRHPLDGRRQHQPQRRLPPDEHRRAGLLAAEPRLVAGLRPGQREPEPARASSSSARPSRPKGRLGARRAASCPPPTRGTLVSDRKDPIANLRTAPPRPPSQRDQLDALRRLNELASRRHVADDSRLAARIVRFELAFRMQPAPRGLRRRRESRATRRALRPRRAGHSDTSASNACMAGRLAERGVRFVQVYLHRRPAHRTSCQLWDQHGDLRDRAAEELRRTPTSPSPACSPT